MPLSYLPTAFRITASELRSLRRRLLWSQRNESGAQGRQSRQERSPEEFGARGPASRWEIPHIRVPCS